jgi:hypothetical protein
MTLDSFFAQLDKLTQSALARDAQAALPDEVDVDGHVIEHPHCGMWGESVILIGKAQRYGDRWRCLADVAGALCTVELTIRYSNNEYQDERHEP